MKVAVEIKNDCVARRARRTCEAADADASVNGGEGGGSHFQVGKGFDLLRLRFGWKHKESRVNFLDLILPLFFNLLGPNCQIYVGKI